MIYDCFTYNGEKDILDIRINMLAPHVDFFVICESKQTFSGKEKPIYCTGENPRIIHLIAPNIETTNAFERAFKQKEFIKTALKDCSDDDTIYYGDVDEIWKPQDVKDDKVYSLEQLNYCYYLNNRSSERWVGTIVGKWGTIKTKDLAYWRATHTNEIPNAGWHFTSMGGLDEIKRKLESYDHQEYNTDEVKDSLGMAMKYGDDYVGRAVDWEGKPFVMQLDESELPSYIISNKEKYVAYFK